VEFEGGNPSYPIWSGCFWGEGELPEEATSPTQKLIVTAGISLLLDDTPGEGNISLIGLDPAAAEPFLVKLTGQSMTFDLTPALLNLTAETIELSLGEASITLTPAMVSINEDALQVI
jgi:hypothetical protein